MQGYGMVVQNGTELARNIQYFLTLRGLLTSLEEEIRYITFENSDTHILFGPNEFWGLCLASLLFPMQAKVVLKNIAGTKSYKIVTK